MWKKLRRLGVKINKKFKNLSRKVPSLPKRLGNKTKKSSPNLGRRVVKLQSKSGRRILRPRRNPGKRTPKLQSKGGKRTARLCKNPGKRALNPQSKRGRRRRRLQKNPWRRLPKRLKLDRRSKQKKCAINLTSDNNNHLMQTRKLRPLKGQSGRELPILNQRDLLLQERSLLLRLRDPVLQERGQLPHQKRKLLNQLSLLLHPKRRLCSQRRKKRRLGGSSGLALKRRRLLKRLKRKSLSMSTFNNHQSRKLHTIWMFKPRSKRLSPKNRSNRKKMRSLTHLGGSLALVHLMKRRLKRKPKLNKLQNNNKTRKAIPRLQSTLILSNLSENSSLMSDNNNLCLMSSRRLKCKNRGNQKKRRQLRRNSWILKSPGRKLRSILNPDRRLSPKNSQKRK